MRLVTYADIKRQPRVGIVHGDLIVDPDRALRAAAERRRHGAGQAPQLPAEMVAFLATGPRGRDLGALALEQVAGHGLALTAPDGAPAVVPADGARLLAPVPRPRRIRDYMTYKDHAAGSGLPAAPAFAAMPICYKCNVETIIGPGDPLLWPSYTAQLDFELELGFFISGGGVNLTPEQAAGLIAGVTIFNDVSARDIQMFEMALSIGPSKGKDFCSAMGPCVLTMDEVDEWSVQMAARVNGETWATGTTRDRQFSFAEVLAWASLHEPVYPGEFFAVGTIGGGCGLELDRWIQPGDVVELEASGVGVLSNPVGARETAPPGGGVPSYTGAPPVRVRP
jgi:2-keto-4-pentenoate hydratase/2-oxohepta-3-ene-1,7-dioic acid hydratase in catechol pathway